MDILSQVITADTRRDIITLFIHHHNEKFHLRNLSRLTKKQVNAVSRELSNLVKIGFLSSEFAGKKKYFFINKNFLLLEEFTKMIYKTTGLGRKIVENKKNIGNVDLAIITNNYIKNVHKNQYDIDLLLVGEIIIPVTGQLIKEVEVEQRREIKYTVISREDFDFRRKKKDIFIENILNNDHIVLIGKEIL
ncbi:MAG TPA: hypothetical protein PK957_02685 [Candidatus Dojkabacteria bacterium]|nr:hypothetical protein [Candidatus Dojkabacteria bacterium]HQF37079.1 hypothetical protein [Candidatus Dojkabacteria bacterium]